MAGRSLSQIIFRTSLHTETQALQYFRPKVNPPFLRLITILQAWILLETEIHFPLYNCIQKKKIFAFKTLTKFFFYFRICMDLKIA